MDRIEKAVVSTLVYFDIFSFPLDLEELHRFCPLKVSCEEIKSSVRSLKTKKLITHKCCFYSIANNDQSFSGRVEKYNLSKSKMPLAIRNAEFIGKFPFVRGVAISGSLSKYSADENADIDFFIITERRRLWLCRSFLHFFKKLTYATGKQHHYCMNYFLSIDELELKDKNLYTAIESTTIIPIFQEKTYRLFYKKNDWVTDFLPNQKPWYRNLMSEPSPRLIMKTLIEFIFGGRWGNFWDRSLQKITTYWWRRKFRFQGFPMEYFDNDLRATSGESKYHPFDYQRKILGAYQAKLDAIEIVKS